MSTTSDRLAAALRDRYVIERELGQGGMATVYLARDVRHDRQVAVKVLRPELAAILGADRFLSEIRTTANLQHPHILPLFDSGEADGFLFYVMPLVEGETLRERLSREKQLPVDESVRIAGEVASALDYAHRHQVIHRDIKPENILLHDGSALVADFGIALAASRAGGTRMTETGMSLGTPHYMSPEQAMGEREITARSDVYALGCVLYEMLTGDPPFTGSTAQAIVARVVTERPRSLTAQRHTIPAHLEAAVLTALEKLPADRFASAADFAAAIRDPAYGAGRSTTSVTGAAAAAPGVGPSRALPLALAGLAGIALGAGMGYAVHARPREPVTRYGLALPASQAPLAIAQPIPSPDGSRIAYMGPGSAGPEVWIKARDRYDATPLPATQRATNFAWSPDGQWIAFTAGSELRKIPTVGGGAITLADTVSNSPGLAWLENGNIVYIKQGGVAFWQVPAQGGKSTALYSDSTTLLMPTELPGARGLIFTRCPATCLTRQELWALDFRTGSAHQVVPDAAMGLYAPTGDLLYVRRDGALFAAPFDLHSLATTAPPIPVMDSIAMLEGVLPFFALSRTGTLVTRLGGPLSLTERFTMVWLDRAGHETPVDSSWTFRLTDFGANYGWSLSPDGKQLAIGLATDAGDDIWIKHLPRGPLSRATFDSASEYRPRWMPDGRYLLFGSNRAGAGAGGLYMRRADGTGSDSLIWRAPRGVFEGQFSPDRRWLVFRTGGTMGQSGGRDIVGIRPGVDTTPVPLVATPYDEEAIAISPDGHWLAYESNETGQTEVYLRPFPNTSAGKWQVSNGGGVAPLWARNGHELFYMDANREMTVTTVGSGAEPALGPRRALFRLPDDVYMSLTEFYTPFDVAPDGRFIMARSVSQPGTAQAPLIVVDNWFTELRQRLGQR
ncbi:MAG TPA: protein kinase [Gemmatimonadales bacterium]|nr:protein kinase [Gemmatimonadales bacterium]